MKKKRSPAELISGLRGSKALECSPVAYVVDLLESYFQGNCTAQELCAEYNFATKRAQFVFSHMFKQDIEDNRRVFRKEFLFADGLTEILLLTDEPLDASALDEALRECIEAYLRGLD